MQNFMSLFMISTFLFTFKNNKIAGYSPIYARRFLNRKLSRNLSSKPLDSQNFYISTPIYYVNGSPHLGHAYTSVITDIIARFQSKLGKNVFFLTGTDEHGQKVEQSATASNITTIQFADNVSLQFKNMLNVLSCSNDDFIRTTEIRHKAAVIDLWNRLEARGHIYKGAYEGWYSIRDEAFYAENELIDGKAPTGAAVEWIKEESYFFRLSQWTEKLLEFYESNPDFIGPRGRRNEVISFVGQEGGLRDLSISRTTFSWGIPAPNDSKHVVYVWLDALTNYLSALEYPNMDSEKFKAFWPCSVHIVGKDILRFHAVFWPAFLMAADLKPPKVFFSDIFVLLSFKIFMLFFSIYLFYF
jgi:methionyl-tRNA synthetase